jgi:hypothetical protein
VSSGRWTARDLLFQSGDPNLYAYIGSDPTNSTDSNGLAIDVAAEFAGALDTLRHNPAISKNPPGEPADRLNGHDDVRVSRHRKPRWRLADAQHALARGYGFPSWPDLKGQVKALRRHSVAPPPGRRNHEDGTLEATPRRSGRSSHPIVGTWAARPITDDGDSQPNSDGVLVAFDLADDALILKQIASNVARHVGAHLRTHLTESFP